MSDPDQTLAELVKSGDMTRRWDEARGWLYSLTPKGEAHARSLMKTPPMEEDTAAGALAGFVFGASAAADPPRAAFCDDCATRAASSTELVRALLEMAVEMSALYANADEVLRDITRDDIDVVKQLRLMFFASAAPARARVALDLLAKAGVRPH